jgi:hypothetical protein
MGSRDSRLRRVTVQNHQPDRDLILQDRRNPTPITPITQWGEGERVGRWGRWGKWEKKSINPKSKI